MNNLLLMHSGGEPFDAEALGRIFQSVQGFRDVRFDDPGGALVEADFHDSGGQTIVGLTNSRKGILLSGTSDVALRAALVLYRSLDKPLRIVDTSYSFDLSLADYSNIEELLAAIEATQTG